jgi:hypothetical protein
MGGIGEQALVCARVCVCMSVYMWVGGCVRACVQCAAIAIC